MLSKHVYTGTDTAQPLLTIAIPAYRRPAMLVEAVASALAQDFDRTVEILVVDDDPECRGHTQLLDALPELRFANFRYLVNERNMGLFPNWNRCILLARGRWVTILNDDDLLDTDFLRTMFAVLDRHPGIDGLVCRKTDFDQRASEKHLPARSWPRRLAARVLVEANFHGRTARRIRPRKLFWGPLLGNGAGFLFKRDLVLGMGGYFYEDEMSADYGLYIRLAQRHDLRQHRAEKARVRIAENESAKPETLRMFIDQSHRLQHMLAGTSVPGWWRIFSPMTIARMRGHYRQLWHHDVPQADIERRLGVRIPRDRPLVYRAVRLLMRGF